MRELERLLGKTLEAEIPKGNAGADPLKETVAALARRGRFQVKPLSEALGVGALQPGRSAETTSVGTPLPI